MSGSSHGQQQHHGMAPNPRMNLPNEASNGQRPASGQVMNRAVPTAPPQTASQPLQYAYQSTQQQTSQQQQPYVGNPQYTTGYGQRMPGPPMNVRPYYVQPMAVQPVMPQTHQPASYAPPQAQQLQQHNGRMNQPAMWNSGQTNPPAMGNNGQMPANDVPMDLSGAPNPYYQRQTVTQQRTHTVIRAPLQQDGLWPAQMQQRPVQGVQQGPLPPNPYYQPQQVQYTQQCWGPRAGTYRGPQPGQQMAPQLMGPPQVMGPPYMPPFTQSLQTMAPPRPYQPGGTDGSNRYHPYQQVAEGTGPQPPSQSAAAPPRNLVQSAGRSGRNVPTSAASNFGGLIGPNGLIASGRELHNALIAAFGSEAASNIVNQMHDLHSSSDLAGNQPTTSGSGRSNGRDSQQRMTESEQEYNGSLWAQAVREGENQAREAAEEADGAFNINRMYDSLLQLSENLSNFQPKGLRKNEINELTDIYKYRSGANNMEETRCSICLVDWVENVSIRKLECKHEFHADCIEQWLKDHRTCAVCRWDLKLRRYKLAEDAAESENDYDDSSD